MPTNTAVKNDRAAYSPAEFAKLFGKHPSFAYRLLYSNKVKAIPNLGRILIPHSERERLVGSAETYNPKPRPKKEQEAEKPELVEA